MPGIPISTSKRLFPFPFFIARKDGQTDVVLHRQDACNKHRCTAYNLAKERLHSYKIANPIDSTAHYARHCINLLSEYQRDFVDENIANHTARSSGDATHNDGNPEGIAQRKALTHTNHRKQCQSDTVENEERIVQMDKMLSEKDHPKQGKPGTYQVDGVRHPAGSDVQQQITYRTAADGSYKTYYIRPKPVEAFGRSQTYAADSEGKRTDKIEYLNKCWYITVNLSAK